VSRTDAPPRWLLLAHLLPARTSNARVKTWRRLKQIGAVPTRNSVYVLPNTEACREDFEWIRSEIVALGGEATVFAADALNAEGAGDIEATFRRVRDADYLELTRDLERLIVRSRSARSKGGGDEAKLRAVNQMRERFNDIRRVDFFRAPAGDAAADAIAVLEQRLAGRNAGGREAGMRVASKTFMNRRWVTRPRPGVDRMASAWLIRRFIDPKATFGFVDRPAGADVPFDMYGGEFSHQGERCTFEVLAQRFGITDASVARLAQVVHDLDMKENRYCAPEAPAVSRMVEGLRQLHADDAALLEQGMTMFDALARSFELSAAPRRTTKARGKRTTNRRGTRR
jgi:hypothetical protein